MMIPMDLQYLCMFNSFTYFRNTKYLSYLIAVHGEVAETLFLVVSCFTIRVSCALTRAETLCLIKLHIIINTFHHRRILY